MQASSSLTGDNNKKQQESTPTLYLIGHNIVKQKTKQQHCSIKVYLSTKSKSQAGWPILE